MAEATLSDAISAVRRATSRLPRQQFAVDSLGNLNVLRRGLRSMLFFCPGGRRSRSNVRILIGKQRSGPARVADCLNSRKPVRKKERAALRRPYTDVSGRRRSDRQRSPLRVPAGRGVAKAGKPNHHHRPGRRLWSAASLVYGGRNKAELERIGGRGERRSREKTKAGNRNQLVA